ncbi:hypothetical protein COU01_03730 [Candidatus Falkowbacteria bacterium CG10_big_fil_rev_8_21_14_0_10_44_15]|uniref:Septum formation initiator n=1 Tax=Candidatus Falkowbacteria bacterium CG10_big_fil_rev_8_21_14_0_10_44_15 TaxID=1974569 RepID=A0A2H0UZ38_9BACT|nr:MAG: hypothetical protein COU01_03730 [Candidatus Falkowbacteria bacterium CG10_big_fil_rev_8_21_14_0_10_44_15]
MRFRGIKTDSIFKRGLWRSKILAIIILAAVILILFPLTKKINQQRALNKEIRELEAEAERIDNKNKDLGELLNYLQSDGFAEKEARLNLDLKKPGEKVVIVKDAARLPTAPEQSKSVFNIPGLDKNITETKSNPRKWLDYFFNAASSR